MTDNPRVQQLLDELLDSHSTPEEVCGSCPELLPEIRARWRKICRARAELDALFPAPPEPGASPPAFGREGATPYVRDGDRVGGGAGPPARASEGMALPRIPGYEVEAVLGRGGMGVVFQARHLPLKRSEEHTSELQSLRHLVCRLLL